MAGYSAFTPYQLYGDMADNPWMGLVNDPSALNNNNGEWNIRGTLGNTQIAPWQLDGWFSKVGLDKNKFNLQAQNMGYDINNLTSDQIHNVANALNNGADPKELSFWESPTGKNLVGGLQLAGGLFGGIWNTIQGNRQYHLARDNLNLNRAKFEDDKQRYWQKWERQNVARNDAML